MLDQPSKKVRLCQERAAVCRRQADLAADAKTRAAFMAIATTWLRLAVCFERADAAEQSFDTQGFGPLMFRCPSTQRLLNTGIETSYAALRRSWGALIDVVCEDCGETHDIHIRDGLIQGARAREVECAAPDRQEASALLPENRDEEISMGEQAPI